MKRLVLCLAFLGALMLSPQLSTRVFACVCAGTPAIGTSLGASTAVFAGQVVWGDMFTARIQVDRVWKGEERSEMTMLTGAMDLGNGMVRSSSCDYNYATGQRYVIYASGPPQSLIVQGCSRTAIATNEEMIGLDALVPHKKIGSETRRCTTPAAGEIRLAVASSNRTALPAVTAIVEGMGRSASARTDETGTAAFSGLQPGAYKVTADLEGYAPKQLSVTVPENGCMEASLFLSRNSN